MYRLISTFAVAKLVRLSFTDNSKEREAGSQLIALELAFVPEVLRKASVVLSYIHQIRIFLGKLTINSKNSNPERKFSFRYLLIREL